MFSRTKSKKMFLEAKHCMLADQIPYEVKWNILVCGIIEKGNKWAWITGPSWQGGWR